MESYFNNLKTTIEKFPVDAIFNGNEVVFLHKEQHLTIVFFESYFPQKNKITLPIDYLETQFDKVVYFIQSKLQLNKIIYARLCTIQKIDKSTAANFINNYHLLNWVNCVHNYGLFYNNELLCVASFSNGRKMNRLAPNQRSFELIRFCTKGGITVTGGLTKLLNHFCTEKNPGDVMTYIDKQFSNGQSFITAGFKLHSETLPNYFLVNKKTFERTLIKNYFVDFDKSQFYLTQNFGNLKLVYTYKKLL